MMLKWEYIKDNLYCIKRYGFILFISNTQKASVQQYMMYSLSDGNLLLSLSKEQEAPSAFPQETVIIQSCYENMKSYICCLKVRADGVLCFYREILP